MAGAVAGAATGVAARLSPPLKVGGWRLVTVSGVAAGLALSPFLPVGEGPLRAVAGLVCLLVLLTHRGRLGSTGTLLVLIASLLVGLTAGNARLTAIDAAALNLRPGTGVRLSGHVGTAPRFSRGVARFLFDSGSGRVMVESPGPLGDLAAGSGAVVAGEVRLPPDWYRPNLDRQGVSMMLYASSVTQSSGRRGGVAGAIDWLRGRAEEALGRAMPPRETALARGFVLGQDQEIDPATVTDFQNSGLAHLLAVSGQNVVLLSLLGIGVMALAGVGYRTRLVVLACLILIYVPLAGGGPSIQRAGVMGLAGLAALAASRPTSRLFVLALAVAVTLLINPRATTDVGWQLSFAAVVGIALLARPFRDRLAALFPADGLGGRGSKPEAILLDGVAVTVAASLVTAPLMAFHFDRIPVATIAANLAALPAVAPAMWLGMAAAGLGVVWGGLAIPLNLLNSLLLAYIAQVAAWFGRPTWAVVELGIGSPAGLLAVYGALAIAVVATLLLTRRLPAESGEWLPKSELWRRRGGAGVILAVLLAGLLVVLPGDGRRHLDAPEKGEARIDFLDIGQGDSTLIRTPGSDPILVDGGPPGGGIESALDSAGVDRLAAVIATHADLDHVGGLYDVFENHRVDRYMFDGSPKPLLDQARQAGAKPLRLAGGDSFRSDSLTVEVLWPPPRSPDFLPPGDRNIRSVTLLVSWRGFRLLITGDGEAEAVPVDPGPLDVLRVAHHGSDDAGLANLLDETAPRLAVISVGEDNPYGHPTPDTVAALAEAGVPVLRTDLDGSVSLVFSKDGLSLETGG